MKSCFDRLRRPKHTSHPESAGSAGAVRGASPNFGSPAQRVPKFLPFPARPAGGRAVTGVGQMGRRPGKKRRRTSAGPPQTRKGGSREEEPLPPWCSLLRLSSKESRAPPPESAGPPGRCAPKVLRSYPPVGYAAPCCPWQGDRVWTGAGSGRKPSRGGTTLCYGTQKS